MECTEALQIHAIKTDTNRKEYNMKQVHFVISVTHQRGSTSHITKHWTMQKSIRNELECLRKFQEMLDFEHIG